MKLGPGEAVTCSEHREESLTAVEEGFDVLYSGFKWKIRLSATEAGDLSVMNSCLSPGIFEVVWPFSTLRPDAVQFLKFNFFRFTISDVIRLAVIDRGPFNTFWKMDFLTCPQGLFSSQSKGLSPGHGFLQGLFFSSCGDGFPAPVITVVLWARNSFFLKI